MAYPDQPASPGMTSPRRMANRNTNRYSVTALFSMAAEQDVEVEDDLARGSCFSDSSYLNICDSKKTAQKRLRDLKGKISAQSKKNFVLERDVRYLDSRIALLIQNRMALDEVSSSAKHLTILDAIDSIPTSSNVK
jgi:Ras GTPase-activating-like protein IQGAP2/3